MERNLASEMRFPASRVEAASGIPVDGKQQEAQGE
jgi:hypothetical protein